MKRFLCDSLRAEEAYSYVWEIGILSRLKHPNVVALYGVCVIPPFVVRRLRYCLPLRPQQQAFLNCDAAQCLVMEVTERGSLFHVLTKERRLRRAVRALQAASKPVKRSIAAELLSPTRMLFLMRDAWRGLAFLHSAPAVVHGDIKSLNMLIGALWVLD